jgi:hypothetical protein
MSAISQQTQDLITKALADKDSAAQADATAKQADAALAQAQAADQQAQSATTVAHKTADASAHAAVAALAGELGVPFPS